MCVGDKCSHMETTTETYNTAVAFLSPPLSFSPLLCLCLSLFLSLFVPHSLSHVHIHTLSKVFACLYYVHEKARLQGAFLLGKEQKKL